MRMSSCSISQSRPSSRPVIPSDWAKQVPFDHIEEGVLNMAAFVTDLQVINMATGQNRETLVDPSK